MTKKINLSKLLLTINSFFTCGATSFESPPLSTLTELIIKTKS